MASVEEGVSSALEWDTPLFRQARAQLEQALPYADVGESVAERLRYPERAVIAHACRSQLDDGTVAVFPAYRVQHSTVLGPTKGGIRYDAHVTPRRVRGARDVDDLEVRAAAPPLRRRQGRRPLQPARALAGELQRLTRRYTSELLAVHRAARGHPRAGHGDERADDGLDDGHLLDAEGLRRARDRDRQADLDRRLGLPARGDRRGRRDGRSSARASGSAGSSRSSAASCRASATSAGSRRSELAERGADVIAVSDVSGGVYDAERARRRRRCTRGSAEHGSLAELPRARARSRTPSCSSSDCDVLVLAAREDQVTAENARPHRRAARRRGRERPDRRSRPTRSSPSAASPCCPTCSRTPAASPSPTSSGCRTSAACSGTRDEIRARLAEKLGDAFDRVWALSEQRDLTLRDAALVAGIREVAAALEARGIYP